MTRASPDALLELHAASQFYLRRRSMKDIEERERLRRALRALFKARAAEIPPDLATDGSEAFALLREAVLRCRRFAVPCDQVAAAVNREWQPSEERYG